jgi:hypothetical protein
MVFSVVSSELTRRSWFGEDEEGVVWATYEGCSIFEGFLVERDPVMIWISAASSMSRGTAQRTRSSWTRS